MSPRAGQAQLLRCCLNWLSTSFDAGGDGAAVPAAGRSFPGGSRLPHSHDARAGMSLHHQAPLLPGPACHHQVTTPQPCMLLLFPHPRLAPSAPSSALWSEVHVAASVSDAYAQVPCSARAQQLHPSVPPTVSLSLEPAVCQHAESAEQQPCMALHSWISQILELTPQHLIISLVWCRLCWYGSAPGC